MQYHLAPQWGMQTDLHSDLVMKGIVSSRFLNCVLKTGKKINAVLIPARLA